MDDEGDEVYMAGAVHGPESHDVIVPVGDIVKVSTIETIIENSDSTLLSNLTHTSRWRIR